MQQLMGRRVFLFIKMKIKNKGDGLQASGSRKRYIRKNPLLGGVRGGFKNSKAKKSPPWRGRGGFKLY